METNDIAGISSERAETTAQKLLQLSDNLVDTLNVVDGMAREGWAAINNEMQAYETIIFKGGDVIKALRTLAMRLDRAALIKFN